MQRHIIVLSMLVAATLALAMPTHAQQPPGDDPLTAAKTEVEETVRDITGDPSLGPLIKQVGHEVDGLRSDVAKIIDPHGGQGEAGDGGTGGGDDGAGADAPSLGAALLGAGTFAAGLAAIGLLGLAGLAGGAMSLVSRYVDPKVALDNPQRSMLFGFIKGNPGVHLKQLSEDFDMKTSTVLWHVRKLEAAELVRSQKVNGFRVFYPVAGGLEAKKIGAAVAALGNENALRILEYVSARPGIDQRTIADTLDINPGTVRWHLRKLRDRGILREVTEGRSSLFSATELGSRALRQTRGAVVPGALGGTPAPAADATSTSA